jgi:hypothetical protein
VTTLADSGPGSLRQAILDANDTPGDDTITFKVTGTIQLARALPNLSSNIDMQGPGAGSLTVRRNTGGAYRIFTVDRGATVVLSGLTITNGYSSGLDSAGISNRGTLILNDSTVSYNYSEGGVYIAGTGIENTGTLTLNSSTISNNYSDSGFGILNSGILTLNNSTVRDNYSDYLGGGISTQGTLTLNSSTVSNNYCNDSGDGIVNGGTMTLNYSTVSGNRGGSYPSTPGISNYGTALLNSSTVSGNDAGIVNYDTALLNSSTVSGNGAGLRAGGITNVAYNRDATVILLNSTIANNTVSSSERTSSQIYTGQQSGGTGRATVQFRNTIISGGGERPNFFADAGGTFVTEGHNLSNDASGDLNPELDDLPSTDPLLGPLQDNGGPTFTHALLEGSPAIDAGDNTDAPDWDQRGEGFPRIVNKTIDIGAYEVQDDGGALGGGHSRSVLPRALSAPAVASLFAREDLDLGHHDTIPVVLPAGPAALPVAEPSRPVAAVEISYNQALGGLGDGDGTDGLGVGGGVYNLGTFLFDSAAGKRDVWEVDHDQAESA